MYVHALHGVHALSDLRVAGARLGDGESDYFAHITACTFAWSDSEEAL
jgi:hypothetical protein